MSFSTQTKNELCQTSLNKPCCALAEAMGVLLFGNTFTASHIRLITTHQPFARRLPTLFHKAFGVTFDTFPQEEASSYRFSMEDPQKIATLLHALGGEPDHFSCHINFPLLEDSCCRLAFCRGAFLSGGSMTDPKKDYHLELTTSHLSVSRELPVLLHECNFYPKSLPRKGHHVTYFKQSNHIEDFLTAIGAPISAMEVMNIKLEKNLLRNVNRRVNCDAANLDKAVDAAQTLIQVIRKLEASGVMETLPEKLQETAKLRIEHPHCTLTQLAELFTPPISKSALNHRLRKLTALGATLDPSPELSTTKETIHE